MPSRRSPAVLVPFFGLIYAAGVLLYVTVEGFVVGFFAGQPVFLIALLVIFGVVYLALAYLIWLGKRWAYPAAMLLSALFIVQFLGQLSASLSGFSNVQEFVEVISAVSALILVVVYSLGGAWTSFRKAPAGAARMIPLTSTLALVTIGFVIGASMIGAVAGGDIASIVANSSTKADITIVVGAGNPSNGLAFSPSNYTVTVGQTVVWVNNYYASNTVIYTSIPSGASPFDSGNLASGQEFSWTPTVPGVYHYVCTIHPFMKGIVVVISA